MDKKIEHSVMQAFLAEHSFVESNIRSFNNFIDARMQEIVSDVSRTLPDEEIKIELGKIRAGKPDIVEADGSKRPILPAEARLRNLTYAAPLFLEINIKKEGGTEHNEVEIGRIPIMVKSKSCHLYGFSTEQLIEANNDPADPGGYFIINGNERVLVMIEDLAPNQPFIEADAKGKLMLRLFSARGAYRIPTVLSETSEGILEVGFSRFKAIPAILMLKTLGMTKDVEIAAAIGKEYDSLVVSLYETAGVRGAQDAAYKIAELTGLSGTKKEMLDKVVERIDNYFLPHIGIGAESREEKALTLCKLIKQFFVVTREHKVPSDKDHYANKRIKLSGDLLSDLFRVNLAVLTRDIQHSLQQISKRKKFYSIKTLAKSTLFSHRIESTIATGSWIGERTGVTQNMDKTNYLAMISQLQRVVSMLPSEQENFRARTLHPTHYGRFCPVETPEGTPIGLRKNLALLSRISTAVELNEKEFIEQLNSLGLKQTK